MQIDRYNYLQFPRDHPANTAGSESTPASPGTGVTKSSVPTAAAQVPGNSAPVGSVVLKIQSPNGASADAAARDATVYTAARKIPVPDTAAADSQSLEHQRAVDRNAGVLTQITLNKDGVLVAKPQTAADSKAPDFVALAVSAMREFSDEADRQKARAAASSAAAPEAPRSNAFKGLQQLAARFNVFA
jgi:hypothetical protein